MLTVFFPRAAAVFSSAVLVDAEYQALWPIQDPNCKEPYNVISARRQPPTKNHISGVGRSNLFSKYTLAAVIALEKKWTCIPPKQAPPGGPRAHHVIVCDK